jgi:glycosyltransferase involved in cell wall biosynthesis
VPDLRILIASGVPRQREAGAAGVVLAHERELIKLGHSVESWFLDDVLPESKRGGRFEAFRFAAAVSRRIRRDKQAFDVVNLHAPSGFFYGIYRRLFRTQRLPPYVMTLQGSEERYVVTMRNEDRKGRASYFNWKNRAWHRVYHQRMYDYSMKTADYGAVANREAWSLAELRFGKPSGTVRYVPNGVEPRFLIERRYSAGLAKPDEKTPLRLLFVGTWLDRKGVFYLAQAFSKLISNDRNVTLTVAGCTTPENQVKDFFAPEARDRVTVVPRVPREDMPALYAEHDIFVFPSLMEGMPLTLLEAMATAIPVVITEIPGMVELVDDEFNGLLVQTADSTGLAAAIERMCSSPELRAQLGQAAQATMRRYTWDLVTLGIEQLLAAAVESERTRRGTR